jgi:hypothetical protein
LPGKLKNFAYRCPSCREIFEVSTLENFPEPKGINKKSSNARNAGVGTGPRYSGLKNEPPQRVKVLSMFV